MNRIFYSSDDPNQPKSYEQGVDAAVRTRPPSESFLLVQGPLTPYLRWAGGKPHLQMDDGDLALSRRYAPARLDRWVRQGIHVVGRPDRVFIKLHCHGATDRDRFTLLGEDLPALFTDAEQRYNDGAQYRLHYVTAREMFNIVKATESGSASETAFDFLLPCPSSPRMENGLPGVVSVSK